MATGKSTVSNMLRELGIPVIDADAMARRYLPDHSHLCLFHHDISSPDVIFARIVEPGRKAWKEIRAEFGQCVFHDNGELNRAALRTIIFEVKHSPCRLLLPVVRPNIRTGALTSLISLTCLTS